MIMKQYIVTLTEDGEECVCGRYDTIEEAKLHLVSVRYFPEYRRSLECLNISADGMMGFGQDIGGPFTYQITIQQI